MTATETRPEIVDTPGMMSEHKVPLALIRRTNNVRRDLGDLTSLRASIRSVGIIEPVLLRPLEEPPPGMADGDGCKFELVAGFRRCEAAHLEGYTRVQANVRYMSDAQALEAQLTENLERKELLATEEGDGYARLAAMGLSQRDIAEQFDVDQSHVSKMMKLARLPEPARAAVDAGPDAGGITRETGLQLAGLPEATVTGLFRNGTPSKYFVDQAAREHALSVRRTQAEGEARKSGARVVAKEKVSYDLDVDPFVWLSVLISAGRTPDPHSGEPCHAVAYDGHAMASVCTDPARHPEPEITKEQRAKADKLAAESRAYRDPPLPGQRSTGQSVAAEQKERERREAAERDERLKAADDRARTAAIAAADTERRFAFCKHLIGTVHLNSIVALASAVLPMAADEDLSMALRLLGIEADDQDDWEKHVPALWLFAGSNPRTQAQALHAHALTVGEGRAKPAGWLETPIDQDLRSRYFAYLVGKGYELSPVEAEWAALPADDPAEATIDSGPTDEEPKPVEVQVNRRYVWGWHGADLHVDLRFGRDPGTTLDKVFDGMPPERDPDNQFGGSDGDRKGALPRIIAEHYASTQLGRSAGAAEIRLVARLCNAKDKAMGGKVFRVTEADVAGVIFDEDADSAPVVAIARLSAFIFEVACTCGARVEVETRAAAEASKAAHLADEHGQEVGE